MTLLLMIMSIVMLVTAGRYWERSRYPELTKRRLMLASILTGASGVYFFIAAIGEAAT